MPTQAFQPDHIPQAAALLASQSQFMLDEFPLLPSRTTEWETSKAFLTTLVNKPNSRGVVMLENGEMTGYLLGSYEDNLFFGEHVWVPFGGIALQKPDEVNTLKQLYAAAGKRWIEDHVLNHYLVCPALPAWLQAYFSLTFGQEQAYAVTSVAKPRPEVAPPPGILLREVRPSDASQLFQKGHWIAAHLNKAPVWEPVPEKHLENILPSYAELADDPTSTTCVAVEDGQIVSYAVIYAAETGAEHFLGTTRAAHFAAAATHPDYRSRGIGRALFTRILNIAHQQNYETVFTDWRTTNLEAARYWPAFGFATFAYRLLRRVNPRYAPFEPD